MTIFTRSELSSQRVQTVQFCLRVSGSYHYIWEMEFTVRCASLPSLLINGYLTVFSFLILHYSAELWGILVATRWWPASTAHPFTHTHTLTHFCKTYFFSSNVLNPLMCAFGLYLCFALRSGIGRTVILVQTLETQTCKNRLRNTFFLTKNTPTR